MTESLFYGEALAQIGEGEHAEEASDGCRWMASLYQEKTPDAN